MSPSMLKMAGVCNEISDGNITSENITDKNATGKNHVKNHEKGEKEGGKDAGAEGKGKGRESGGGSGDNKRSSTGAAENLTLRDEINAKIDRLKSKENNENNEAHMKNNQKKLSTESQLLGLGLQNNSIYQK